MALAPSTTRKRLSSIAGDIAALQQQLQGRQALGVELVATCSCCSSQPRHGGADLLLIQLGCSNAIPAPIVLPEDDDPSSSDGDADDILSRLGIKR